MRAKRPCLSLSLALSALLVGASASAGVSARLPVQPKTSKCVEVLLNGQIFLEATDQNVLGRGGTGVVYKGKSKSGEVAVKKGNQEALSDEMIRNELLIAKEVFSDSTASQFFVRPLGIENKEGQLYLVSELFSNAKTVTAILRREDAFYLGDAKRVLNPVIQGVALMHRMGLIHRDIASKNILVRGKGDSIEAKAFDFGVSANEATVREQGMAYKSLGTADYMPPEALIEGVWKTKDFDPYQVDLWGVSCTFYEMVTGSTPFGNVRFDREIFDNAEDFLAGKFKIPVDKMRPDVKAFFEKAFDVDWRKRFRSIQELHAAFEALTPPK